MRGGLGKTESTLELQNVRVSFACKQRWDDMVGDDRVRVCNGCDRPVFNLSEMTRADAEGVLATRGLTPCVRFYRRPDGTVMTADCPTRPRRHLAVIASSLAGATLAVTPAALADPPSAGSDQQLDDADHTDGSGSGSISDIFGPDSMFTMGVLSPHVVDDPPPRPAVEWSIWGRLGIGITSQHSDVAARSVSEPASTAGSSVAFAAAATADVTFGIGLHDDVRLGAWAELRTSSGPVAGGELVIEALPTYAHTSRGGSLALRLGASPSVVTAELAIGYVGSWNPPSIRWLRHVAGARIVLGVDRAIDAPNDWSATVGLEVDPIGALHAIYDLVNDD
ncbi:MAG TPA: hypothetical protein VGG28_23195 [Kofleriaceae bacterium]